MKTIDFTLLGEIAAEGKNVEAAMRRANTEWDELVAFTRDNKAIIDRLRELERNVEKARADLTTVRNDALEKIGWKVKAETGEKP